MHKSFGNRIEVERDTQAWSNTVYARLEYKNE